MSTPLVVAVLIGLLALALLVSVFAIKRSQGETFAADYRGLFIMGIAWLPIA